MPPRRGDLEDQRRAFDLGLCHGGIALNLDLAQLVVMPCLPKGRLAQAALQRFGQDDIAVLVVRVDHRHATRLHPVKDAGFFNRNGGDILKGFEVDGGDIGHHRRIGPRLFGEGGNLAGVVHADLDHRVIGIARHPR